MMGACGVVFGCDGSDPRVVEWVDEIAVLHRLVGNPVTSIPTAVANKSGSLWCILDDEGAYREPSVENMRGMAQLNRCGADVSIVFGTVVFIWVDQLTGETVSIPRDIERMLVNECQIKCSNVCD
jgi:hypothetical protein